MTCVLAVANQKGGVGKTTTAINLAAAIALKKRKHFSSISIPQSNATIAFFAPDEMTSTMYDIFAEHPVEMAKIIRPTKDPKLFVAPARLALAKLEQQLAGQFDAPFKLKDALAPIQKDYDYIVMDTPPALGILTVNALVASTHLLVPIQAAYFAIEGTDDLLETYERIRARPNPGLKVLGVVITLFDKRTNISRDTHEQIRTVFGEVLFKTQISKNVRLEESPAYKETIFTFAPKSPGAQEYQKLPWRLSNVSKRIGLPVTLKMRHDAHYVETLTSYSGAAIGRMIPIDKIRPNPDQPRKAHGRFARTDRFHSRKRRAGAAAGALHAARGCLLHHFRRAPLSRFAGGRAARSSVHRENCGRRGNPGTRADRKFAAQGPDAVRGSRRLAAAGGPIRLHA